MEGDKNEKPRLFYRLYTTIACASCWEPYSVRSSQTKEITHFSSHEAHVSDKQNGGWTVPGTSANSEVIFHKFL